MGNDAIKAASKKPDEWITSPASSLFEFKANLISGETVNLADVLKDKKTTLIVNVASNWDLTKKNYEELVRLHRELEPKGLQILAFPCNQFKHQEPGTNKEIQEWASKNYDVQFPMFEKTEVNGENAS